MYGKSDMSDRLVKTLPSASREIFLRKKHTVLNETAPSPGITGEQTLLLYITVYSIVASWDPINLEV
jgi:hypothetical protein